MVRVMAKIYHGGGLDAAIAQYGGACAEWLDLSTGINPNAYPVGNLAADIWQCLPDKNAEEALMNAAYKYYQVPDGVEIVAAPGTQAIIELLPNLLNAKQVDILSPTYAEHAHCWEKVGARVRPILHLESITETDVLVAVNPNNPTTEVHAKETLCAAAERVEFMTVDEAFCDPMPELSIVPVLPDNAIVLKSFGKFFGLAGLRLGFAICNPTLAAKLRQRFGPWAVSGPALAIGAQGFNDTNWVAKMRIELQTSSRTLADVVERSGLEVCGVNPLFVYAKSEQAQALFRHLVTNHILVRQFPEQSEYLRFGLCKDDAKLERLEKVLKSYG